MDWDLGPVPQSGPNDRELNSFAATCFFCLLTLTDPPVTTCNTLPTAHPVGSDDVVAVNTTTNHQISYKSSANLWRLWTPTVNTYKKTCGKAIKKTKTRANKARTSKEVSVGARKACSNMAANSENLAIFAL